LSQHTDSARSIPQGSDQIDCTDCREVIQSQIPQVQQLLSLEP
jgi:hypothetical protein